MAVMRAFEELASDFPSQGARCRGNLYLPHGSQNPPVVVMSQGFAAERCFRLPAYAERFAAAGMAVYLFDYRGFGDSEGEPRYLVSPSRHVQDLQAALAHVRSLPNVNGERVALWGSSYGGGHVIVVAAHDPHVAAIVVQVAHVDSISAMRQLGLRYVVQGSFHALWDVLAMVARRSPHYVKAIGAPNEFAVMNTPESLVGYSSMIPVGSRWQNKCLGRSLLLFIPYRPTTIADKVRCPALVVLAENDSLCPARAAGQVAARLPHGTLLRYPVGHFGVYSGPVFEDIVARQTTFLAQHLLP